MKELKERWDASKSPAANLENLGLVARPNGSRNPTTQKSAAEGSSPSVIELFDIPDSDAPGLRKRFPLEKEEEEYMAKCMKKHGDDYLSMFRDTKVNKLQHTEKKLRKMGARYLLLTPEQRRVEVPENIKDLLPDDQNDGNE